ncbi:MAG TPA: hypothetical protein VJU61_00290 [Polyangiaceae bacterium]|nr:hypothetical protein [Polyangiaceae bacterium]
MRRSRAVLVTCTLAFLGCGGQAEVDVTRRGADVPSPRPSKVRDGGVDAGAPSLVPSPPVDMSEPEPFEDPGCPPVPPAPARNDCDPLAEPSGCGESQSCFPFVIYPEGPCEVEQYGTMCLLAGPGTQGDACSRQGCAAGHICVLTGRGTQCARVCSFADGAPEVCAPGLLCQPIDIEGFGSCL